MMNERRPTTGEIIREIAKSTTANIKFELKKEINELILKRTFAVLSPHMNRRAADNPKNIKPTLMNPAGRPITVRIAVIIKRFLRRAFCISSVSP